MAPSANLWNRAGSLSPVAFQVGGLSILLDAVVQGTAALTSITVADWINTVLGLGGLWVAMFGLIGVYPYLADHSRRLAQGGGLTGTVGWLLLTGALGWAVILNFSGEGSGNDSAATILVVPALALALLSFLLYGVVSIRTEYPSRTVGYLFLVPFVGFLLLVLIFFGTNSANMQFPVWLAAGLFGVVALSIIALGTRLRRDTGA